MLSAVWTDILTWCLCAWEKWNRGPWITFRDERSDVSMAKIRNLTPFWGRGNFCGSGFRSVLLRPFQNVFGISSLIGNSPQSDWNFSEQLIYDSLSSQNKLFKLWDVIHSYSQGAYLPLPIKNCIFPWLFLPHSSATSNVISVAMLFDCLLLHSPSKAVQELEDLIHFKAF